jgi:hypothetical protein
MGTIEMALVFPRNITILGELSERWGHHIAILINLFLTLLKSTLYK